MLDILIGITMEEMVVHVLESGPGDLNLVVAELKHLVVLLVIQLMVQLVHMD